MIRGRSCLLAAELGRAATDGPDAAEAAHIETCSSCGAQWQALQALKQLAQNATWDVPGVEHRTKVKAQLLSRAKRKKSEGRMDGLGKAVAIFAMSAASAGLVWWVTSSPPAVTITVPATPRAPTVSASVLRAQLHDHGHANYVRLGSQPDEIVRLIDGSLTLQVSPLQAGERFRIVTADAEVEVRGTAFDIVVEHDVLKYVHVWHGRVEVRPVGGEVAIIDGGQWWRAPTEAPAPAKGARVTRFSKQVLAPTSRAPGMAHDPGEDMFAQGWSLLKGGAYEDAAKAFARASEGPNDSASAEDATFWEAVAWARAKRPAVAMQGLQRFLTRFPQSPRVPEAQTSLAWLLFDSGELERARVLFESASRSSVADVAERAREGIMQIEQRTGSK